MDTAVPRAPHPTYHVGVPIQRVLVEECVQNGEPGEDAEAAADHPTVGRKSTVRRCGSQNLCLTLALSQEDSLDPSVLL